MVVTVHHFRVWDFAKDEWTYPPLKSTAERIEKEVRGEMIPGTAEEVDPDTLDEHGRYDPKKSEALDLSEIVDVHARYPAGRRWRLPPRRQSRNLPPR